MERGLVSEIDTWISVGKAIEIDKKVLYLVAKAAILKGGLGNLGCSISPLAILVTESAHVYAISLTDEKITVDQLLAIAPSLERIAGNVNKANI